MRRDNHTFTQDKKQLNNKEIIQWKENKELVRITKERIWENYKKKTAKQRDSSRFHRTFSPEKKYFNTKAFRWAKLISNFYYY